MTVSRLVREVGVALVSVMVCGASVSLVAAEGFGPLPARNFQPIQLLVLGMPGDRAAVLSKGTLDLRLELAETASVFNEHRAQADAVVKFETLRSGVFFRYGLTDRVELGAEIPAFYRYRGFLEGAITATERATTGLNPPREALRGTGYAYSVTKNNQVLFQGSLGAVGLGDLSLFTKYEMLSQTGSLPTLALRVAVKLPTGDQEQLFGSGHPDVGMGLAAEKTFAGRWVAYVNVNEVFPTGRISGLTLRPVFSSMAALEYLWSQDLSFTLQYAYYQSPFHGTGLNVLDQGVAEVAAGFNYRLRPNVLWQVYGVENLDSVSSSGADFTLSTVITYRFNP